MWTWQPVSGVTANALVLTLLAFLPVLFFAELITRWRRRVPPRLTPQVHIAEDLQPGIERGVRENTFLEDTSNRYRKYGHTFTARTRDVLEIHTIDPENLQSMLAHQFEDFGLEPLRRNMQPAFWGRGILNSDGSYWKHSRAMLRPMFKRTEWGNTNLLKPHIERLLDIVTRENSADESIDLEPLLRNYVFDTSTEFIFGQAVGAQNAIQPDEGKAFMQAYSSISTATGKGREVGSKRPWLTRWFGRKWTPQYDDAPTQVIHGFIEKRVQQAIVAKRNRRRDKDANEDGRDRVIALKELVEITEDVATVRSQLLHMFMPASETTAVLIGSTLYALARAPEVWDRLRNDVLEHVSDDYSLAQVKNVPYLRWVLQEALRLYPPIVGSKRVALRDTSLSRGGYVTDIAHQSGTPKESISLSVPKGTIVHTSVWALHRDPGLWGEDAHEFRPERWATERQDWRFLPFNGGPRICLAQQYVLAEASFVLVGLLKRFERIEPRDDKPWVEALRFTMRNKWGVKVHLTSAR